MKKTIIFIIMSSFIFLSGCATSIFNRPTAQDYVQRVPAAENIPYNQRYINTETSVKQFKYDSPYLDGQIDIDTYKNEMLRAINDIRSHPQYCSSAQAPLEWNRILQSAAMEHSKDLALNKMVSHSGSGTVLDVASKGGIGSKFYERLTYFGYPVRAKMLLGEAITRTNIKMTGSKKLYPNFIRALQIVLKDPPHCKIIMNPRFDYVGVGVYRVPNYYYFVFNFAQKPN